VIICSPNQQASQRRRRKKTKSQWPLLWCLFNQQMHQSLQHPLWHINHNLCIPSLQ
jgi:hypothetical protein